MKRERTLKTVNGSDYLTVEETAKTLGVKTTAIRNYLYLGKLTTYKFKNLTLLDSQEVIGWKGHQKK